MKQPSKNSLNLAILVVSCDNYSDLWQPFFTLLRRFWLDCSYNVYLLSNFKKHDEEGVIPILVGEDVSWSDNIIKALAVIDEEYVLMVIDDLFLNKYVQLDKLQKVFAWIAKEKPSYVGLNNLPRPDKPFNEQVGIISQGTLYRTTTVMSVWNKKVLLDLLKPAENAWEFEVYGTIRSDKYKDFYCTWQVIIPVVNGVIKGKWQRSAVRCLKALGVPLQLSKRRVMTSWETVVFYADIFRSRVLQWFPPRHRRRIKDLFTRGQCNYSIKN